MRCLLLGGGGSVGTAALYLMKKLHWRAWVVDPHLPSHQECHARNLQRTVEGWTEKAYTVNDLHKKLEREHFDLVIDLTPTLDKRQSITTCDKLGISLINTTMVDDKDDIHVAAFDFLENRPQAPHRPHIVASGMNPGAVNAMAEEIIGKYEQPDAIVYWEYDETLPCDGVLTGPSTTWSQKESGEEINLDWTFEVVEEGTIILHEDALSWHPQNFRSCGVPVDHLRIPQDADPFLIGHEECVYMGWLHDTAAKFVYSYHPQNMKFMRAAGYGWQPRVLLQSPQLPLVGRDIVGVACQYLDDGWVGEYCLLENTAGIPPDTNATCWLVAAGVIASGVYLNQSRVQPGVYLTHELPGWMEALRSLVQVHSYKLIGNEGKTFEEDVISKGVRSHVP